MKLYQNPVRQIFVSYIPNKNGLKQSDDLSTLLFDFSFLTLLYSRPLGNWR